MKKLILSSLVALLMTAVVFVGCQSLSVENQNEPNEARALATPSDIESLIKGSFLQWFEAVQDDEPSMGLAVMSDAYTCSWGNFGMSALSQEPRVEFNNSSSYSRANITEDPWFRGYAAISSANDGIRNISSGTVDLGPGNERALAFAKFVQGLTHGWLACYFDQAFIFDETVDITTDVIELQPYNLVMEAAITQLEDAVSQFNASSFSTPDDWINGRSYTSAELAELANSFIARYMVSVARDPSERAAVNWTKVMGHINNGIKTDWGVKGNGGGRGDPWYSPVHWYSAEHATWQRVDYRTIGPSDISSAYADWSALAPADRDEFIIDTPDLRIWDQTLDANGVQNPGTVMKQIGATTFPGGGYHRSRYGQDTFNEYRFITQTGSEAIMYRLEEHDLMMAEGLLHTGGSAAQIAALLDKTYSVKGGYPSAATLPVGSINDDPDPKPGSATLWSVLKYEKTIETLGTFSGLHYFDKRGWGDLASKTLLHFPVPAKDLETLQLNIYTHGGDEGDRAPKRSLPTLQPPEY